MGLSSCLTLSGVWHESLPQSLVFRESKPSKDMIFLTLFLLLHENLSAPPPPPCRRWLLRPLDRFILHTNNMDLGSRFDVELLLLEVCFIYCLWFLETLCLITEASQSLWSRFRFFFFQDQTIYVCLQNSRRDGCPPGLGSYHSTSVWGSVTTQTTFLNIYYVQQVNTCAWTKTAISSVEMYRTGKIWPICQATVEPTLAAVCGSDLTIKATFDALTTK